VSAPEVVTFGETMASLRSGTPLRMGGTLALSMAGSESNVAIGLTRLGHSVRWGGRVGADEVGTFILRTLRSESVLIDTVEIDPDRSTGLMLAERRISDLSRVSYYRERSAGSALSASDATRALEDIPRILHVTGITPALSSTAAAAVDWAVRYARDAGALVSVDVNYRTRLWSIDEARPVLSALVRGADIVIASEDELDLVVAEASDERATADELGEFGVRDLVIKRGARGATVWRNGVAFHADAIRIPVLDTIGAGDALTAGYLSGLLDGVPPAEALHRGTVTAAFAVATVGDWEGLPNRDELSLLDNESGTTLR
jgi:2-dehydro-3-deoxygluconokinase